MSSEISEFADHYVRENKDPNKTRESGFLIEREFQATAVEIEGRTVDVRIVPFNEVARVADPPEFREYQEEWMPGCFDHQLRAANRVHANVNHSKHVIDTVGHGLALRSEDDGYHGTFTILETQAGDTTLALLRGGALPAVSLEAVPVRNTRTSAGIVQRVKANLRGIAFCREGAFRGAQVLAVREAQTFDEELLPVDLDPKLVERLRAQGISLPDRYTAHPAQGTPDESGTPDDGTRQSDNDKSSEE